jgi:hypothetical protein
MHNKDKPWSYVQSQDLPQERNASGAIELDLRAQPQENTEMSLRIRFRFDGKCSVHPRYNPEKDGRPQHNDCSGCESLFVIHLYTRIARRKADAGEGIIVSRPAVQASTEEPAPETEEVLTDNREQTETESGDAAPTT